MNLQTELKSAVGPSLGGLVSLNTVSRNQDLIGGVWQLKVNVREETFGQVQIHIWEHSTELGWVGHCLTKSKES